MAKRKQDSANITHGATNVVKKLRQALGKSTLAKKSAQAKFKSAQGKSPESKFFDTNINVSMITAGSVTALNIPIEGTDYNNRVGRKIEMTSVSLDMSAVQSVANFGAAGSGGIAGVLNFRVALVYDKQPTPATAVTYQQIYNNVTSILTPYEPRLVDNIERFEVLKVWNSSLDTANRLSERMNAYLSMNHEVRFNATNGGTVADITTGTLYLVVASDVTTGANNPDLLGVVRVRFHDL